MTEQLSDIKLKEVPNIELPNQEKYVGVRT